MSAWETGASVAKKATILLPDGSVKDLKVGASFISTIRKAAKDVGLAKFRVFVDDKEIVETKKAPSKIKAGAKISIAPYDKAAI